MGYFLHFNITLALCGCIDRETYFDFALNFSIHSRVNKRQFKGES